ncbi:hypothetical protein MNBD_CHLOROFLEXI01-5030 [hydrothermal vent metagenome]|uniref:Uncharacterized protein n=1 Tax=hydrothermal vent metagenome TaxID=652676 RepID=A0A3B0VIZ2_9ZZZZ
MFNKFLQYLAQRKRLLVITILISTAIIFFSIPVASDRLISNEWCGFPNPFIKWTFSDDGSFQQNVIIIDSVGAGTGYFDTGVWTESARTIRVVILEEEILELNQQFIIISAGLGHYLWSYGDFLGDLNESRNRILIWHQCSAS